MKKTIITLLAIIGIIPAMAQWKPAGEKIMSPWAEKIDVNNVMGEYPRPIMERSEWMNLNGLWNYAITERGKQQPKQFDGQILVPFCVESSLSGVMRNVTEKDEIWYQRTFTVPAKWKNQHILLNFEAVDWKADVWVNGIKVGQHTGGYAPFQFDITAALKTGQNEITVKVWDPTDHGYVPRGKQVIGGSGIFYTPVSGIWETVWLEPVAAQSIAAIKTTPNIDSNILSVEVTTAACPRDSKFEVRVLDGGKVVATGAALGGQTAEINMPADVKLWSPEAPNLYDLEVVLLDGGKQVDKVKSYAAMRKYSKERINGILRLCLNNEPIFHYGPLDQGWWPGGLYTAPCDEALKYDLIKTKEWGFNMIRKHVKVEPRRWYTYCDQLGILVWQDMPNGDKSPQWMNDRFFDGAENVRSAESEACYRKEWKEIMDNLYSYPCISVWVPFNESWGQFKTQEIIEWTKQYDPTRLVNPASGGNYYHTGDILDIHHYPGPGMPLYDSQRINVLGEFGGIGRPIEGHLWQNDRNWGYVQFNSAKEVTDEYVKYVRQLIDFVGRGFSAGVYTQTTDVEGEINGIMTYDRKVIKMEEDRVREVNQALIHSLHR